MIALLFGFCLATAAGPDCTLETLTQREYAVFDTLEECKDKRAELVAQHNGQEPSPNIYLQCQENFTPQKGDVDETLELKKSQEQNKHSDDN